MIYVAHIYEVSEQDAPLFTSSFDSDGLLAITVGTLPGHLHTQLLRHSALPQIYLAIEFWITEHQYLRARQCLEKKVWDEWLRLTTVTQNHLGVFQTRSAERGDDANTIRSSGARHDNSWSVI